VRLMLQDASGREVSRNFYWLSTTEDQLNWQKTEWYYTPTTRHANLRALEGLAETRLALTTTFDRGDEGVARVTIANTGRALAFQIRLRLIDPDTRNEILPVFWEDNYFELLPGARRDVRVSFRRDAAARPPLVDAQPWNKVVAGPER